MNRNEILLRIEELVKKLDDQQRRLQSFGGEIPAVESDLLQRQVRQLYELTLELEKWRAEPVQASAPVDPVQLPDAVVVPEPAPAVAPPAHESPAEHILVEAAKRTEAVQNDVAPAAGIKAPKIKGEVNSVLFRDNPTVGDRFEDEPTIHERIASTHATSSIASHQQRKAITSLKKAIGLNEKFLFINQLFDGNLQVYNQAIDFLDAAPEKEAALEYLRNTLIPQFGWDVQGKPFMIFAELVERRYTG